MSEDPAQPSPHHILEKRLAHIEARLANLESELEVRAMASTSAPSPAALTPAFPPSTPGEDELEFTIGQNWFARAGILILTLGVALLLLLPYAALPPLAPSLIGFAAVAALFSLAALWRNSFELVASYLFGAAMGLLYFSTLRLCFPEARHVLSIDSVAARGLLVAISAANLIIALRRQSRWLVGIALLTGCASALAVNTPLFVLAATLLLAVTGTGIARARDWPSMLIATPTLAFASYFVWAIGNPFRGGAFHFGAESAASPFVLLAAIMIFAAGAVWRGHREQEDAATNSAALVNCMAGYGVFLIHTGAAYQSIFVGVHLLASVVLLGIAVLFWRSERSYVSTFFYAMTGYVALSMAILKVSTMPNVFIWLSLQSVVVVTTAIWFRSRFIVVANFIIFVAIVFGYMLLADRETGISVGFGIVALLSARILNWQRRRLELRTELMRNAYLTSALFVFPYALYHLVPPSYVGLAWIGLASMYYALNLIVQNQKYRWMGHATLLFTTLYLVVIGTRQFEPEYRIISFLALGAVLLIVSLSFTRVQRRRREQAAKQTPG
jgi:uncharacterized membrane protein